MSLVFRNNRLDLDRFFNDVWAPTGVKQPAEAFYSPRVDVAEKADYYEITAELPGVDKDDIQVHVKEGVLTLEAETQREEREEEAGRLIRQERRFGKFKRSFKLGTAVREEDIKASFKNGLLVLEAPKLVEKAPERRRIDVH